jgi:two-component system, response regulator
VSQLANILLVEDNPNDVELTLRAFAANRISNEIAVVRDGADALDYVFGDAARAAALSVILLDLKLPKVDGLDVLKRLKSDQTTKHIPVVIMTSSQEESDRISTYDLGANSYIVKPVDFEKFTESVRLIGLYWLLLNLPAVAQSSS